MDTILKDKWFSLSLIEQMINIGNEVKRAFKCEDIKRRNVFLDNAIEYTRLSIIDPKNNKVVPELKISEEVLIDYKGLRRLNCSKEQINKYYLEFTYMM